MLNLLSVTLITFYLVSILDHSNGFKSSAVRFMHRRTSVAGISTSFRMALSDESVPKPQIDNYEDLRQKLKGTCIYFVGMMGSGKSTVGKVLAEKIGYRFMDTDEAAEFMIEMPISEYFAQGNQESFRDVEYQVLMELAQYTRLVISTGGGIVERNMNWGVMRNGLVIFLDMIPADIYKRLSKDEKEISKRPLLQGPDPLGKLTQLSESRRDKYLQADVIVPINSDLDPNALAADVVKRILDFIRENPPMWQQWKQKRESVAVDAGILLDVARPCLSDFGSMCYSDQLISNCFYIFNSCTHEPIGYSRSWRRLWNRKKRCVDCKKICIEFFLFHFYVKWL
jgi:shikimate kinase